MILLIPTQRLGAYVIMKSVHCYKNFKDGNNLYFYENIAVLQQNFFVMSRGMTLFKSYHAIPGTGSAL
jgi:hypothetical protein